MRLVDISNVSTIARVSRRDKNSPEHAHTSSCPPMFWRILLWEGGKENLHKESEVNAAVLTTLHYL